MLINPNDYEKKEIQLTDPMMRIRLVRAQYTYLLGSRGSFKSTMGIPYYLTDCIYGMPGATGIICGPSFEHLLDNTLNPCFNALMQNGFVEGVHFVIGKRPPKEWAKPLIRVPADKYSHLISWHNGSNQFMVSMEKKGSANGISCQYGVFDEAKLLKINELEDIVFPAFRGNEYYFKNSSLYLSKFFATDKLAEYNQIKWLLDKEKDNNYEKIELIVNLQLHLNLLLDEYNKSGINKRDRLRPQIHALETRLNLLRKNTSFYVETNVIDSVKILGEDWLKDKKSSTKKKYIFDVAYMNNNPDRPEEVFYPDFDEQIHTHHSNDDYESDKSLIIAIDYQHSVIPILISQIGKIPSLSDDTYLKFIDAVDELAPSGLEEAIDSLCEKYENHRAKTIYYIYDQTATGKRVNALEYYKIVVNKLRKSKWRVIEIRTGRQPSHFDKYIDTKAWLKRERKGLLPIIFNKERCEYPIKSILKAPAKTNSKGLTEKDKKYEDTKTYPNLDQRETTHYSDCFDMTTHAVLKLKMVTSAYSSGFGVGMR